jgi:hypothetical protein
MTPDRLQQLPSVISTVCSGETIVIHPATGVFYGFSRSASLAWAALAEPRTPAEVTEIVRECHSEVPATAIADVAALLAELRAEGLLVPAEPANNSVFPIPTTRIPYTPATLHRGSLKQAANGATGSNDGQTTGFGGSLLS